MLNIALDHGLSEDEYYLILKLLGRTPNLTELGIFSVLWSEHCSYKSSKIHLKKLPTSAPWVIQGPGENAGVIDIGDGLAAVFKIESHNHPSFIEPYQGAATGVGGILRDVFTMGARPIANLNALRFGAPNHPKTKALVQGVVAGIGGYGNCMGIPTVGGECEFHPAYNGNILVNAMTVGIAKQDKIFYAAAAGVGNPVVYVGAKTGRDGIKGASMASAEFADDADSKRPTVQVGDPFVEKLLLEACLELMASDAIVAIQDMGAAGLTSSSVEMAAKGGIGVRLDLDKVPQRETQMTAYEMMLSESQERMLMVLKPGREAAAQEIFRRWGVDFAVIGELIAEPVLILNHHGHQVAHIPLSAIAEGMPEYDRSHVPTPAAARCKDASVAWKHSLPDTLKKLLGHPSMASKRWIWEQYDRSVGNQTLADSGGDAAVVRVYGTDKALAMATDCTPRYCQADPVMGGRQAVAEACRNLNAVGATPLALTNNLNFGNPQKPLIMGQIVGALEGMGEACRALNAPIVSGNVSLYNETNGQPILPTPVVGGVGLLRDYRKRVGNAFIQAGQTIYLLGETKGWLGCSRYREIIDGVEFEAPPPVDLTVEARHGEAVRRAIALGNVKACHDLSGGGLLVGLAHMGMASGFGFEIIDVPETPAFLFGEDQGRYLVVTENPEAFAGLPLRRLGTVTPGKVRVNGKELGTIADYVAVFEETLPALVG